VPRLGLIAILMIWFGFWQVGVLIKSANGALQQLGKWMAPDRASV
jgi:aldehyde dehydrogenase (NAD+)